ncbi:23S rRNA (adenine(2503)-C(2))-methyltransferase RlmN [Candidatus Latescibacterota bacterium]
MNQQNALAGTDIMWYIHAQRKVSSMKKNSLTGLLPEEISALLPKKKESYRGMQIFRWIHEHGVSSFDEMTNLSKAFREEIKNIFSIGAIEMVNVQTSSDSTTSKFLWSLHDGNKVESVIIRDEKRSTACISSQAGCKFGCAFCRTGGMGFKRNLTSGEIIDQLIKMKQHLKEKDEKISNIVFMGMGEPLDNLDEVIRAIKIINMEEALEISQYKVTVSTCGITPGIAVLSKTFKKIGLAISLNAPENELRNKLMPCNRAYPLNDLLKATGDYAKSSGRRVTFEYILIDNVNDSLKSARKLLEITKKIPSKINLIAFNEFEGSPFKRPSDKRIEAFQRILFEGHTTAIIRKSKGTDILAACGQLATKMET